MIEPAPLKRRFGFPTRVCQLQEGQTHAPQIGDGYVPEGAVIVRTRTSVVCPYCQGPMSRIAAHGMGRVLTERDARGMFLIDSAPYGYTALGCPPCQKIFWSRPVVDGQ